MSISPLQFFLNIAVGTKIWQSRCRMGPQLARHRELRSPASNGSEFLLLQWGARQDCTHILVAFPQSDSVWCSVLVALSTPLSVPSLLSPSEVGEKAPLFSSSPVRPMILLCCTLFCRSVKVQGSDFSIAGYLDLITHPMLSANNLYGSLVCF